MSMLPLSISSAYEGLLISAITLCAPSRLASIAERMFASSEFVSDGEHVRAVDVLLDQQLFVRGVAVQHDGVLEQLGDACARAAGRAR